MATHTTTGHPLSLSNLSISPLQSNHIDLTLDDDDDNVYAKPDAYSPSRAAKRQRTEAIPETGQNRHQLSPNHPSNAHTPIPPSPSHSPVPRSWNSQQQAAQLQAKLAESPFRSPHIVTVNQPGIAPPAQYGAPLAAPPPGWAAYPPQTSQHLGPPRRPIAPVQTPTPTHQGADRQVIDLTSSPSPPPPNFGSLPADLPPKTPVCIGQLRVTALVLYPIPYLQARDPNSGFAEWAIARLQHEHSTNNPPGPETIKIKTPHIRGPNGETYASETFGVVEQKVANVLGPMLAKGLIRLDSMVRKGPPNLPILALQILAFTPKGNIPVVGNYLQSNGLLLDHPTPPFDVEKLANYHYFNPHNPPPGGHNRTLFASNRLGAGPQGNSRWGTANATTKSVEVQRHQIDEVFKNLKDGEELAETEPFQDVATKLYPHQKKALTFLLEREREAVGPDGKNSSLWQHKRNQAQESWYHLITEKESFEPPQEAKGAILADDMGLGKTITCVSLIANTLTSAKEFAAQGKDALPPPPRPQEDLPASQFADSIWGMPDVSEPGPLSAKGKAKAAKLQDQMEVEYTRACRIKTKSRATLIICPLSTVSNWEDQFREHWRGEVTICGGSGGVCPPASQSGFQAATSQAPTDVASGSKPTARVRQGTALRLYVYHGNARRPDPAFLGDFDVVITTYATLASEFSKQNKSRSAEEDDDDGNSSDGAEVDEFGNPVVKLSKSKAGTKRKKSAATSGNAANEIPSALQSIHWFRVVLDEAHSIKEPGTVASRASCDLIADRRLCLTGTPVQNKLDDVFALIKFLRLAPLDDKNTWTSYIGTPVKYGQSLGIARLQTIMKCITLRRTKETTTPDGKKILSLPPRHDEIRYLQFDEKEKGIYDQFYNESKAEFNDLSNKNEVMKNYVGILQKILRLRQICDHFELVEGKGPSISSQDPTTACDALRFDLTKDGINQNRANAIFAILRESATAQCVECGVELCASADSIQADALEGDTTSTKRNRKIKGQISRTSRANSPSPPPRAVLTRCQHLFCLECYRNCICPGWPLVPPDLYKSCSTCQTALSVADAVEVKPDSIPDASKKKAQRRERRQKGSGLENYQASTKIKTLMDDLLLLSSGNPYSANYDPHAIEVQMVDNNGNAVEDGIVKTVVFSQWTSMLDKIEEALELAQIRYDRLDGTMKRDDRTRAMDALKYDPGCEVLLVSLKAGGVGLNLTAAQRVYLMDPYWNPAVENQAVDRIHRLGQTRPVTTIKLIIDNSIEARLLEVQRKKTELANMTLGHNFSKAELLQRRMEELSELFGS
ncbi:hypothetical protein BDN72DRAFT_807909 [Pluteus cervinus]|uniref:Uncharacterized protein n=1 Tax=Pluteus cervinus TaxID=181527 RepID=A0ACD3BHA7_9AGAR|nr:hypothetical protein BDN72DRAFT_807909 [Pluteus cervinus]